MKLHGYEAQAFKAWENCDRDFSVMSFAVIASKAGVEKAKVRRAVRGLARKGLVVFVRVSWTDDGELYGAGYGLTDAGAALYAANAAAGMPV